MPPGAARCKGAPASFAVSASGTNGGSRRPVPVGAGKPQGWRMRRDRTGAEF